MTDPVPSKDRLAELIADYQLRYDQRDCKCETSDELSCKCCRRVCVCHFDFDTIAALKEIVSLREDCRRWENARNVWMAEEKRLKAQVEELSIHAEKWVKRALGSAPEPAADQLAAADAVNYGSGFVRVMPDGTREHVPHHDVFIELSDSAQPPRDGQ